MKALVVLPMVGVGPVHLGATREQVHAALGHPEAGFLKVPTCEHRTDTWFDGCLQVFYEGESPAVSFIELSRGVGFEASLFGLPVFATRVPVLVAELSHHSQLEASDPELGFSFKFPSIELALWRPSDDDEEEPHVSTVGIGVPGYFSR